MKIGHLVILNAVQDMRISRDRNNGRRLYTQSKSMQIFYDAQGTLTPQSKVGSTLN